MRDFNYQSDRKNTSLTCVIYFNLNFFLVKRELKMVQMKQLGHEIYFVEIFLLRRFAWLGDWGFLVSWKHEIRLLLFAWMRDFNYHNKRRKIATNIFPLKFAPTSVVLFTFRLTLLLLDSCQSGGVLIFIEISLVHTGILQ